MPATASRAEYVKTGYRTVRNGPDAAVATKYGDAARKTIEPVATFFEAEADAQAMCDERMALLSPDRRKLSQSVSGEMTGLSFNYTITTPQAQIVDDRRLVDHASLIAEFSIDFGKSQTSVESWGGLETFYRITDAGDSRTTDDGDFRVGG
jgi:hypothetical protein